MNKPPAFMFYADDFLAGTFHMTQAEVGAYIRLLCYQWNRGEVPRSTTVQQRLAGGLVSRAVREKFVVVGGKRINERLEQERDKQNMFRQKQSEKGKKSAQLRSTAVEPRCNRKATGGQPPLVEPEGNLPLSVSVSVSKEATKLTTKGDQALKTAAKLTPTAREIAARFEAALGMQWVNDAGKWVNRIKTTRNKAERVIAEIESAIKEERIKSTPAQYGEQIWKEFE